MSRKSFFKRFAGLFFALLLIPLAGVFPGSNVNAQGRFRGRVVIVGPYRPFGYGWYGYPYGYRGGYYNEYVFRDSESAQSNGYEDGFQTGNADFRKNQSYNPERSHFFREAGFGNFAGVFRHGFINGYRDGWQAAQNGRR